MKLSTLNGKMNYLAIGTNAKTAKGDDDTKLTAIMYLAPAEISGYEVCPSRSKGCTEACLFTAGRGAMSNVQKARIRKTVEFFEQQDMFLKNLNADIKLFQEYCEEQGLDGYVRLNGTSDIKWEDYIDMESYSLFFYDYTKRRDRDFENLPSNYRITFSRAEDTVEKDLIEVLDITNVAVVFDEVPATWSVGGKDVTVIEGDLTDLRYEDPKGVVIGLKAKGMAKKDDSGFVVQLKGA